jgi:hypothetical protein
VTVPVRPLPGLSGRSVADWLTGRLTDVLPQGTAIIGSGKAYQADGSIIKSPDRLVILTRTGGPGLAYEGLFDGISFQARTRGAQGDPDDAEDIAGYVDSAFVDASTPFDMSGHHVTRISRLGGPPAFLLTDSAGRTHLTANYVILASR